MANAPIELPPSRAEMQAMTDDIANGDQSWRPTIVQRYIDFRARQSAAFVESSKNINETLAAQEPAARASPGAARLQSAGESSLLRARMIDAEVSALRDGSKALKDVVHHSSVNELSEAEAENSAELFLRINDK